MLSLRTNLTALMVQKNLNKATEGLNKAIQQLTTGSKLNSSKDNPANYAIKIQMQTKLSAWETAEDNIMMGNDLLETASGSAQLISNHLTRIRDLCEQSCNGIYSEQSIKAIKSEINARLDEIYRIKDSTEYNDIKLFDKDRDINIQVGINSSKSSVISINTELDLSKLSEIENGNITEPSILDNIDNILNTILDYEVRIGASQNRLEYALQSAEVMKTNLTSSLSNINDADIAKASSDFIKYQILQQASAINYRALHYS